jgi:phenol 2-monooxygenase
VLFQSFNFSIPIKTMKEVDVVICGSGSAGISAAVWLACYGIRCTVLEKRPGPMEIGQADGVQCRTVEIFDSLGIAEELLREAYHVLEVAFWSSNDGTGITRTSRTADTQPGLSYLPHCILNQARINGLLLQCMQRSNDQQVDYGYDVLGVEVDSSEAADQNAYPVTVTARKNGEEEIFKAKYVLASDGAHSAVRKALGFKMIGDSSDSIWGVMDIYPRTNFPDIRKKCTIRTTQGNLLIIPREGGSLVRFYMELHGIGLDAKSVKKEDLHEAAKQILAPYEIEFADTFWWSAYAIGQRLADNFSKDNRVFLTGDSCHTHSPKAGQGMNMSLQDGYNIGWKLASVLTGRAGPDLLQTYDLERQKTAADLIDFDRYFTKLFSTAAKDEVSPEMFAEGFIKSGKYTAGLTTAYSDSMITSADEKGSTLATNIVVGMRFPSAQVVRFCDAKAMQLAKALPSDGRWRVVVFAGDIGTSMASSRLLKLAEYLRSGPVRKYTRHGADIDSFLEPLVVLSGRRVDFEQEMIPDYFWPETGKWKIRDLHKTFVDDMSYNSGHGQALKTYGVDPENGAIVIVRPDQYVSKIVAFEHMEDIGTFFEGWCLPQ